MREFTTSAKRVKGEDEFEGEPIEFAIDGDVFTAYPPKPAQVAIFMAAQSKRAEIADQIAGFIDFFDGLLDESDQVVFRNRLLDRDDSMDLDAVMEIIEYLIEEWSARPTQPSSESSALPQTSGRKSTAKPRSKAASTS